MLSLLLPLRPWLVRSRRYVADNDAFCDDFSDARSTWGGAAKTNESPCYVMPNKTSANLDFFQLEILMNAAGSSLDYETSTGSGETFREAGVTLIMQVDVSGGRARAKR